MTPAGTWPDGTGPEGVPMKNRVVVGLLLWLTAVCTVAGLAWFAIDSAGKSVTALPIAPSGVSDQIEPEPEPTPSLAPTSTSTTAPPTSPSPTGVSTGAVGLSTEPPTATSTSPSPSRTKSPSPSPTTSRPTPKPSPPRTRTDSTSGFWGSVSAACTGGKLEYANAVPANDWSVTPTERQRNVSAKFQFNGEHGDKVKVAVSCSNGRPAFDVEKD